jgi:hypothetical protein
MDFEIIKNVFVGLLEGSEKRQDKIFNRIKNLPGDEEDRKKLYNIEISNSKYEIWIRLVVFVSILILLFAFCYVFLFKDKLEDNVDHAAGILISKTDDDNKYFIERDADFNFFITYKNSLEESKKLGDIEKPKVADAIEILINSKEDDPNYKIVENGGKKPIIAYENEEKVLGSLDIGNLNIEKYTKFDNGTATYKPKIKDLKESDIGNIELIVEKTDPINEVKVLFDSIKTFNKEGTPWEFSIRVKEFIDINPTDTIVDGYYWVDFSEGGIVWSDKKRVDITPSGRIKDRRTFLVGKEGWERTYSVVVGLGQPGCKDLLGICNPYDAAYNLNAIVTAVSLSTK